VKLKGTLKIFKELFHYAHHSNETSLKISLYNDSI